MKQKAINTTTDGRWRRALKRLQRGQAMVEYSVITHAIVIGGGLALLPVIAKLLEALDTFYQGIYFVLENGAI